MQKKSLPSLNDNSGFYKYLQEINKIPSLSQEEEFSLAKAYLEEANLEAASKLVTSHLKLVAKIATNYRNYNVPISELVSEGNLGLMQAVKKYNPYLGFRLSTYAMWWIKSAMQEYILKTWSLVKIGTTASQKKLFFNLNKVKNKIANLYSRSVNDLDFPQIAKELGVTCEEVKEMNSRLRGSDLSLNGVVSHNDDSTNGEWIEFLPETRQNQEILFSNADDAKRKHNALMQAMNILNERELQILTARQLEESPSTLESLSVKFKISKERVRQIENKAFQKVQTFILNKTAIGASAFNSIN